jgi:LL-diaminopimelate aminotransferase
MELNAKRGALPTGIFSRLAESKRRLIDSGADVIDLSVGTPDLPPPAHVMEALRGASMDPMNYRYAITDRPQLREAAANWYDRRFSVALDPETQITSLIGEQDGLAHLALALLDPGDTVLVPDPGYPIFSAGPRLAGAELHFMPQVKRNGYIVDLNSIPTHTARAAKLMIISYPANPVAAAAPRSFYRELVAFAHEYDIAVLYDNAYCEMGFDGTTIDSFLSEPGAMDIGIEFNSLSKTYGMSGCRVGFALGNARLIEKLRLIKSQIDYGIFPAVQVAAEAALNGPQDYVAQMRDTYRRRRDLVVGGLAEFGWNVDKPQGTMFVWAALPLGHIDSERFALGLMESTGVITVPGVSFGALGEGHVRIALVQPDGRLREAVTRIGRYLREQRP